jgi:hypothetical protein
MKGQLRLEKYHLVDDHDYVSAAKVHESICRINEKRAEIERIMTLIVPLRRSVTKHQEIETVVAALLKEWDAAYSDFIRAAQEEAERMEEENRRELEYFDDNIPEGLAVEFRKSSPTLLAMRSAERRLALIDRIPAARKMQLRADRVEGTEAQDAYRRQATLIVKRREDLVAAQEARKMNFFRHIQSVRLVQVKARDKAVEGYLARLKRLDKEIDHHAETFGASAEDVCDPEIDEIRADNAVKEQQINPISVFQPCEAYRTAHDAHSARKKAPRIRHPITNQHIRVVPPREYPD